MTDLQSYYDELANHDWFYEYSDDHSVWRKGSSAQTQLRAKSNKAPEHLSLYNAWSSYMFSGDAFGTEKQPKPERPA